VGLATRYELPSVQDATVVHGEGEGTIINVAGNVGLASVDIVAFGVAMRGRSDESRAVCESIEGR
jgi:hypothetical protein